MKTISTFEKLLTPQLLYLMILLIILNSVPAFSQIKHIVNVTDFQFNPGELHISVGDTVEWKNIQGHHNVNGTTVTFPSNPESFGNSQGMGWTYQHVFKTAGNYDYHCDPHYLGGMTGKIEVKDAIVDDGKYELTINFTGMTPHVGQNIYLSLTDKDSGIEIERKKQIGTVSFAIVFSDIEKNHSYNVDFFADHNKNGQYDAPNADHAWRMELNNVMGDTTLMFQHNTNFTDIMWENKLTVHFMGMNPHVGQTFQLAVIDKNSGMEVQRISTVAAVDFMVDVYGIENGMSYNVDFFADHNKNGKYDAPNADHAWRMELNDVMGDTTLMFQHNTTFTDIMWKNKLSVHFMGMNPHVGQTFQLAVIDKNSGMEVQRISTVAAVDFMVDIYGIENGMSYNVVFFADHNKNGKYDAPNADHAWRMELNDVMGDTTLMFQHNTTFTDIIWKNKLSVHFMGMNPHVGQNLQLAVIEKTSGMELQRVSVTASVDFMVDVYGIENGMSYNIDFFADHNSNGAYDAPPTDHAWRMELNDVMGDTTLMFQHNTSFTDINWISTAISELNNSLTKMYPNPANGRLFIEMNESPGAEVQVSIYNISGKLKLQKLINYNNKIELDIQNLNSGVYLIDLRTNNKQQMLKLIKY